MKEAMSSISMVPPTQVQVLGSLIKVEECESVIGIYSFLMHMRLVARIITAKLGQTPLICETLYPHAITL